MKLLTAAKMRELEKRSDASGNTFAQMMEQAGTLTARAIIDTWEIAGQKVLVLVGPGNNGGDGLVCARALHDAAAAVTLYLWKREPSEEDVNWRLCRERGIPYIRAEEDPELARLEQELDDTELIVDALLGTGVARPIEGLLKEVLETVQERLGSTEIHSAQLIAPAHPAAGAQEHSHRPTVVAVDLPTGLNPDTGALDPAAVPADMTVTFAFPKVGQYRFPGAEAVGELVVADIGIPQDWADDVPLSVVTGQELAPLLPARPRSSNKGTFGKALLACGSLDFTGAPRLAAMAAGRVGAGLVTLAVPRTIYPVVGANLNEATYLPLPDLDGAWAPRAVRPLIDHARDYEALLVGCGFGRADSTADFLSRLLGLGSGAARRKSPLPSLVIDADALNLLSEIKNWWTKAKFAVPPILTPHPGEMSRLTGLSISEIQRDRVGIATSYAKLWNTIVVLKGAFTVVANPDGRAALIPFATPALATAGTGDVLAGAIVGFLAQLRAASLKAGEDSPERAAADAFDAAVLGAYIHALAGELAGDEIGLTGVVAGDLAPQLPEAIRLVRGEE